MGLRDELRRLREQAGAQARAVLLVGVVIEYEPGPDEDLFATHGRCSAGLIICVRPRLPRDGHPSVRGVWEPTHTPRDSEGE